MITSGTITNNLLSRLRGGERAAAEAAIGVDLLSRLRGGEPSGHHRINNINLLSRLRGGELLLIPKFSLSINHLQLHPSYNHLSMPSF